MALSRVVLAILFVLLAHECTDARRADDELRKKRTLDKFSTEQQTCIDGLQAFKEKLRKEGGFAIPSEGKNTDAAEGGSNSKEFAWLVHMARTKLATLPGGVGTICQVGFNYGTSSYAFLCDSKATVFSWDFGEHDYVRWASKLIDAEFPGRHKLTLGDSQRTLAEAAGDQGPLGASQKCDVVFVDGGHSYDIAKADITNFARLAAPGAMLVVDDCPVQPTVGDAWVEAVDSGLVVEAQSIDGSTHLGGGRQVCVGSYASSETQAASRNTWHLSRFMRHSVSQVVGIIIIIVAALFVGLMFVKSRTAKSNLLEGI